MGDPHRAQFDLFRATPYNIVSDPGNAGSGSSGQIFIDRQLAIVPIMCVATGGETRTLIQPDRAGLHCLIECRQAGGTLTLTIQGTYDGTNSTVTMNTLGQYLILESVLTAVGSTASGDTYQWRVLASNVASGGQILTQSVETLTVTNETVTNLTITGTTKIPVQALNAAGTNQSTAASLNIGFYNRVTVPSANNGVALPVGAAGQSLLVRMVTSGPLCVYPPVGASINALAANAPFNMANNTADQFVCFNNTQWDTIPAVAS